MKSDVSVFPTGEARAVNVGTKRKPCWVVEGPEPSAEDKAWADEIVNTLHPKMKIQRPEKQMADSYVPLYDMLCEIIHSIKDDPEADSQMKSLAKRGRKVLDEAKARCSETSFKNKSG